MRWQHYSICLQISIEPLWWLSSPRRALPAPAQPSTLHSCLFWERVSSLYFSWPGDSLFKPPFSPVHTRRPWSLAVPLEGYFGCVTRELYLVQVTWFRNPMSPLNSRNRLNINCCSSEGLGPPDLMSHLTGRSPTKFHSKALSYYFWVSNKRICTPVEKQAKNTVRFGHIQALEYLTWVEIIPLRNVHRIHFVLIHCSLGVQELKKNFFFW